MKPTLALLLILLGGAVQAQPRGEVAFYIASYGEVTPERDPRVALAHRVFERVRRVADHNAKRPPRLVVVDGPAEPWAVALPAGHIVLSLEAVAACHRDGDAARTEARLAFVLGHELAHLAADDFWHHEVHGFLAGRPGAGSMAAYLGDRRRDRERELAADDRGYIYAAMAGFAVDSLAEEGFYEQWIGQAQVRPDPSYPDPGQRAALLRARLQNLDDKLGFFRFGARLGHFDYCDDGVYFLREFQKVFPGREVLNDLGYCYLQLARREMAPERAYFYWLPLVLDVETRAAGLSARRGEAAPRSLRQAAAGAGRGFLEEAVDFLSRAAAADPGYLPARLNLAAAHLYLGEPHKARAAIEEAAALAPRDPRVQVLQALSLHEQSDAGLDLWPAAVARLEKLVAASPLAAFNLARLLEVRPRSAAARDHWNRLARQAADLPAPLRDVVCARQALLPARDCGSDPPRTARSPPWPWPLPGTGLARLSRDDAARLAGWRVTAFDWYREQLHGHIYRRPDGGAEVLELDRFVQMQVLRGNDLGSVAALPDYCPRPLRRRELARGTVWSCDDWAALSHGQAVSEIWKVAR